MNTAAGGMRHIEAYGSTLFARVIAAAATLSLHLLVARWLGPSEYAAAALLVTLLAILLLSLSFGNEPLLVREGGASSPRARSVAVFAPVFAGLLAGLVMITAPVIEGMFEIHGLARLLLWGMPVLPLQLMQVVPRAELLRRQEFTRLARTDAYSNIAAWIPAVVYFAISGDIAAVGLYLLVMHGLRLVLYLRYSGLRYRALAGQELRLRQYLRSWRVFSIETCTYLTTTVDDLVVAGNLGAAMLGVYHLCYRVIVVVQDFLAGVMRVLSYPRYTHAAPDREVVYRLFCEDTRFVTAFILPILAAALLVADALLVLMLGAQWSDAVFVFQLLTFEAMRQSLLALGGQVLLALGEERRLLRYSLVSSTVLLPLFVLLSLTDLHTFVLGFVGVNSILNLYFLAIVHRSFARPLRPLLLSWLPGISAAMLLGVLTCGFRMVTPAMPPVALLAVTALLLFLVLGLQMLLLPDLRAALLAATGALRSAADTLRSAVGTLRRSGSGPSQRRVVVSVDGPFDEANPHLKHVYESMQARSGAIEFRPLHLRRSLAEAFRGAWFSGHGAGVSRVIHVHYPLFLYEGSTLTAAVFRGLRSGLLLLALRLAGHRIVCTLHDGAAHDFPFRRWERAFLTLLMQAADRVTTLSEAGQRLLFEEFGRAGYIHIARHCVYDVPAFSPERRRRWRAEHGLSDTDTVILLFGTVKPYKGFADVIDACADVCASLEGRPLTLICAGRGMAELTGGMASPGLRLITMDRFIDGEERTKLMDAADFGVLPYRRILHSGTAMLFASHACPVIAPRTGVFEEHERDFRIGLYYGLAEQDDLRRTFVEAVMLGRSAFTGYFADFHAAHRRSDEVDAFLELYMGLSGEEMFPEGGNLLHR